MRHATNPRVKPGIYLVPNARLDGPGQKTELGLGPESTLSPPANDASADGLGEQPLPLVRPKFQSVEERAAENIEVDVDFDTESEGTAEQLIEESAVSNWVEPPAPAPPIAASVYYPPVAMTSPVDVTPVAPLPPAEPKAESDQEDDELTDELTHTPRARLAHWAAFLILACVIGVGILAFNRALTARSASTPADTASPQPPAPTPPAPVGPSISAALPESATLSEANSSPGSATDGAPASVTASGADQHGLAHASPVGGPANPRVLPPRSTSRAAAAAATAKADWTAAPPPESAQPSAQTSDTGLVSPPTAAESATLSINSIPISNVSVDGQPFGSTPRKVSVAPGKHSVVFRHPELGEKTVTVDVSSGGAAVAAVKF